MSGGAAEPGVIGERFVGRRPELERLLSSSRSGLVTVAGPGGVGKTTFALNAADALNEDFPDGVFLARLAAIADPGLVAAEVASSVGLPRTSGLGYERAIVEWLEGRRALLVLDNCEHVIVGAAELASRLARELPGLLILATSREPLEIPGENIIRLAPFDSPNEDAAPAELAASDAVAMFIDRARSRDSNFEIDDERLAQIGQICRTVDGLPLAIELAAGRVGTLPVSEISAKLEGRLGHFVNRNRLAEERHRTLNATVGWSFALLSPEEQIVFRRLAVFAGGFDLEAAVTVAGEGFDEFEVEEIVLRLAEKSLLAVPDPELARFAMLETVRVFALGKLEQAGEASTVRDRHAAWSLDLGLRAGAALQSGPERPWLEVLGREHDNLRAALDRLIGGSDPADGLALASSLTTFWWTMGHTREGIGWIEKALAAAEPVPPELEAAGLFSLGFLFAHDTDDWARAAEILDRGIAAAEGAEQLESPILGYLLCLRGQAANFAGEHTAALGLTERGTAIIREFGDPWGTGFGLWNVGFTLRQLGEDAAARERFEEMAEIQRANGIGLVLMIACQSLAEIEEAQGNPAAAGDLYEEALGLRLDLGAARLGNIHGSLPGALLDVARTAAAQGNAERAAQAAGEALPIAEELRDDAAIEAARRILGGEGAQLPALTGVFERQGEVWRVGLGGEEAHVPDSKGMRQLRELIFRPGQEIGAVTLSSSLDGSPRDLGDAGEMLDQQAIDQYRSRLGEIEGEIDEATAFNDPERAASLTAEREALVAELARASGLGGRARRAGSAIERSRVNVTRTLRKAIERIEEVAPELGRHLDRSIRTGNFCAYEPPEPIAWRI